MTGGARRSSVARSVVIATAIGLGAGVGCAHGTASRGLQGAGRESPAGAAAASVSGAVAVGARVGAPVIEAGVASYYGRGWQGRRTASGERFDMEAMTAAHHWLPFGTRVRVKLIATGQEVVVVITDRLGAARRVIDLSVAAARELGMLRQGVAPVTLARD